MIQRKNRTFVLFSIVAMLVFLSFYRDYFFKCINAMLQAWDNNMDYPMPSHLNFFLYFEYATVVQLKWVFTLFFALVFYAIAVFSVWYLFAKKQYIRMLSLGFVVLILISAAFIALGFLFPSTAERMYEFARFLMGIAQSPLLLMILIPAFILSEKAE